MSTIDKLLKDLRQYQKAGATMLAKQLGDTSPLAYKLLKDNLQRSNTIFNNLMDKIETEVKKLQEQKADSRTKRRRRCEHCEELVDSKKISYRINPFEEDVHNTIHKQWICDTCHQNLRDDI